MEGEEVFEAYVGEVFARLFEKEDIEIPKSIAHAPDPTKALKHAMKGAVTFFTRRIVQQTIAEDFDARHYRRFDPSCGDDGCQSRPLILQRIRRTYPNTPYAALPQEEKLYLSLCHVLAYHLSDVVDTFDVLLQERQGTHAMCACYGKDSSHRPVLQDGNDAAWVLSYGMASLSVERLRSIRDHYAATTPAVQSLFQKQFSHRGLPQLSTQESEQLLLWDAIDARQHFLHTIRMLRKDSNNHYFLEGYLHMLYLAEPAAIDTIENTVNRSFRLATDTEAEQYAHAPVVTMLSQAMLTEETLPGTHILAKLSGAKGLEDYHEILANTPFPSLLSALSLKDDEGKQRFAETASLFPHAHTLRQGITFEMEYAHNIAGQKGHPDYYRNGTPSPLFGTHWVLSTLENERQAAKNLEEKLARLAAEKGLSHYYEAAHCERLWHLGVEETRCS